MFTRADHILGHKKFLNFIPLPTRVTGLCVAPLPLNVITTVKPIKPSGINEVNEWHMVRARFHTVGVRNGR